MFSPSPALSDKILIYSVCQFIQCLYAYQDRFHLSKLQLWTWSRGITHTADSCKLLPVGSITPLVLKLKLIVTKGCVFCLPWLGFYSCLASNLIFSFPFFYFLSFSVFLFLFCNESQFISSAAEVDRARKSSAKVSPLPAVFCQGHEVGAFLLFTLFGIFFFFLQTGISWSLQMKTLKCVLQLALSHINLETQNYFKYF